MSVLKERDCLQRCDHYWSWRFVGWAGIPQHVTDMYCRECGEYWWWPEKEGILGDWVVIREGSLISSGKSVIELNRERR